MLESLQKKNGSREQTFKIIEMSGDLRIEHLAFFSLLYDLLFKFHTLWSEIILREEEIVERILLYEKYKKFNHFICEPRYIYRCYKM